MPTWPPGSAARRVLRGTAAATSPSLPVCQSSPIRSPRARRASTAATAERPSSATGRDRPCPENPARPGCRRPSVAESRAAPSPPPGGPKPPGGTPGCPSGPIPGGGPIGCGPAGPGPAGMPEPGEPGLAPPLPGVKGGGIAPGEPGLTAPAGMSTAKSAGDCASFFTSCSRRAATSRFGLPFSALARSAWTYRPRYSNSCIACWRTRNLGLSRSAINCAVCLGSALTGQRCSLRKGTLSFGAPASASMARSACRGSVPARSAHSRSRSMAVVPSATC